MVHLTERFAAEVSDLDWIRTLQTEGDWIIISADPRISRNRVEQAAWHESGLTAFFFADFSRQKFWSQAEELVRRWPKIVDVAKASPVGSGFLIRPRQKDFQLIYAPADA